MMGPSFRRSRLEDRDYLRVLWNSDGLFEAVLDVTQ